MSRILRLLLVAVMVAFASTVRAAGEYGQYGPYDYYRPDEAPQHALSLVEGAHYGPRNTLFAVRGDWCAYWGGIDYTLRAFPNHPRALVTMADYLKTRTACKQFGQSSGDPAQLAWQLGKGDWQERNAEYYFSTAILFRPKYAETRLIYAEHLQSTGRTEEADRAVVEAEKVADIASAYERLIRIFARAGETDYLHRLGRLAERTGKLTPKLRDQLIARKVWPLKDPPAAASTTTK